MTSWTSPRLLAIGLLFAVLGAGFAMGAAWGGRGVAAGAVDPVGSESEGRERTLVIDQVGLEEGQREEVDRIVEHFQAQLRELNHEFRQSYRPRERKLLRHTRDSIKTMLSPEQAATYDSLIEARYGNSEGRSSDSRRRDPNQEEGQGGGCD